MRIDAYGTSKPLPLRTAGVFHAEDSVQLERNPVPCLRIVEGSNRVNPLDESVAPSLRVLVPAPNSPVRHLNNRLAMPTGA